jgi:hypothetical protein
VQYHYDLGGTGTNPTETVLTPTTVASSSFGFALQRKVAIDGYAYAQPLFETVTVSGSGTHNLAFVATMHDSLYAIDTDSGAVLWKDSFLSGGLAGATSITSVPAPGDVGTSDSAPEIGICSTPVIDSTTNLIYVLAKTRQIVGSDTGDPYYVQTLYAVDLGTGVIAAKIIVGATKYSTSTGNFTFRTNASATAVQDPFVVGTGDGAITVNGQSRVYFNALREFNRCGLTLSNGIVYIAFASHGDQNPYHGWILGYDKTSLALVAALNVTPNGHRGGLWNCGDSLPVDSAGNLYAVTGNGDFDGDNNSGNGPVTGLTNGFPSNGNYGDCVLKIAPTTATTVSSQGTNGYGLKITDYFSPSNNADLDAGDTDLGSGGCVLLPASAGSSAHPNLMVAAGKDGIIHLLDRSNLGKYGDTNNDVGEVQATGSFGTPAFFNGVLYYFGIGSNGYAYTISNATMNAVSNYTPDTFSWPGAAPVVSANGANTGIVWAVERTSVTLRAYDATNLSSEVYKSSHVSSDALDSVTKFASPTVINGKVLVATNAFLNIYGLSTQASAAPPTVATGTASSIGTSQATLAGTVNPKGTSTSVFFNFGTTTAYGNQTATLSEGSGTTTVAFSSTLTTLSPGTTYHYQAVATNTSGSTVYGLDKTFKTPPVPIVTTAPTANVSASGAEINLAINPEGQSTTFYIQYSTDNSYGTQTASQAISGDSPVNLWTFLPGLAASTTYNYQVVTVTSYGTVVQSSGTFSTLPFDTVLTVATGAPAAGVSSGTFASFGNPATNASGHSAFRGVLQTAPAVGGAPAITSANNVGIWADDVNGTRQLVALTGTSNAPAVVPAPYAALADPVYNANNAVAFTGSLKVGTGLATSATAAGVWTNASGSGVGSLAIVAQAGTQAAGCPAGTNFASFTAIALSDTGSVAMLAHTAVNSAVDSTSATDLGIWATDSNGNLQLIARTGDVVSGKTISSLAFLPAAPSGGTAYGTARGMAPTNGNLTYLATFSDKTTAIINVVFP